MTTGVSRQPEGSLMASPDRASGRGAARQQRLLHHLLPPTVPCSPGLSPGAQVDIVDAAAAEWWVAPDGAHSNVLQQFDMTGQVCLITGGTGEPLAHAACPSSPLHRSVPAPAAAVPSVCAPPPLPAPPHDVLAVREQAGSAPPSPSPLPRPAPPSSSPPPPSSAARTPPQHCRLQRGRRT